MNIHSSLYFARIRDSGGDTARLSAGSDKTLFFARQTREADKGSYNLIAIFEEVLYE